MRFVVLHHTGWPQHADHYDLMLQFQSGRSDDDLILKTFATESDQFPSGDPANNMARLSDHRRAYLSFEGEVSGNRGNVERVDEGELSDISGDAAMNEIQFVLRGKKLSGRFKLIRRAGIYSFEKSS
jgi:hypothetical protein